MIQVRYFAGAREAAGVASEALPGPTTAAGLRTELAARHGAALGEVLPRCALLVAGARATSDETPVPDGTTVDVLPPFAGG
ncbi:MoaD/ThiS family protein [Myceligenerans pegani]|uniref:Molybdopterin synthase sulfur carrier subunit n=1 Tax=Myceligenerans pegani TaxID=2776917 RepID=A0ABR9MWZ1_9MICO|nr:MoaD/ThiS family protein [Myceligenerans sp. TRM 65318]MBE1875907.1 MoaD/ThiS family protein [Myceligenerans sp. TRM 65318]MBE3018178.1 MoaD/ThiS family protein [Myceligenerans sp. TRM 65318]